MKPLFLTARIGLPVLLFTSFAFLANGQTQIPAPLRVPSGASGTVPATNDTSAMPDGFMKFQGKAYLLKGGVATPVQRESIMRLSPDGIITTSDGGTFTLPEGKVIGFDGSTMTVPGTILDTRAAEAAAAGSGENARRLSGLNAGTPAGNTPSSSNAATPGTAPMASGQGTTGGGNQGSPNSRTNNGVGFINGLPLVQPVQNLNGQPLQNQNANGQPSQNGQPTAGANGQNPTNSNANGTGAVNGAAPQSTTGGAAGTNSNATGGTGAKGGAAGGTGAKSGGGAPR